MNTPRPFDPPRAHVSPGGVLPSRIRIGIVLSAGGLRGVAHLGVMRRLLASGVQPDVLVGVSAGAIIAAYWAAVGLSIEEMIADAPTFKGRHLLMHGITLRAPTPLKPLMRRFCGVIPGRLARLDDARFDRLHHGVQSLGVVCHDLVTARPVYFSTANHHGVPLAAVVKCSAAVPGLIPTRPVVRNGRRVHLVDGGVSDSLPCEFARAEGLGATHLIVSDCRRIANETVDGANVAYIRPDLNGAGSFSSPSGSLLESVRRGERACTDEVLETIHRWTGPVLRAAAG